MQVSPPKMCTHALTKRCKGYDIRNVTKRIPLASNVPAQAGSAMGMNKPSIRGRASGVNSKPKTVPTVRTMQLCKSDIARKFAHQLLLFLCLWPVSARSTLTGTSDGIWTFTAIVQGYDFRFTSKTYSGLDWCFKCAKIILLCVMLRLL